MSGPDVEAAVGSGPVGCGAAGSFGTVAGCRTDPCRCDRSASNRTAAAPDRAAGAVTAGRCGVREADRSNSRRSRRGVAQGVVARVGGAGELHVDLAVANLRDHLDRARSAGCRLTVRRCTPSASRIRGAIRTRAGSRADRGAVVEPAARRPGPDRSRSGSGACPGTPRAVPGPVPGLRPVRCWAGRRRRSLGRRRRIGSAWVRRLSRLPRGRRWW